MNVGHYRTGTILAACVIACLCMSGGHAPAQSSAARPGTPAPDEPERRSEGWSWPNAMTAVVAVGALGLGIANALQQRADRKPNARVTLGFGDFATPPDAQPSTVRVMGARGSTLFVDAANAGTRAVHVDAMGVTYPNGAATVVLNDASNVDFPHELREGKRCSGWLSPESVAKTAKGHGFSGTIKLVGYCKDALGNIYKSKPLPFDIEKWAPTDE